MEKLKITQLKSLLEENGVDISILGQSTNKTIEQLQEEIDEGEAVLEIDKNGELIRKVSLACVFVYYQNQSGEKFLLREDKQVFRNGSERKRTMKNSVTEKIKGAETALEASRRGLIEELGITGDFDLKFIEKVNEDENVASAYPGLKTKRTKEIFSIYINDEQYSPEGYQEVQEDKTTYFKWEKVEL